MVFSFIKNLHSLSLCCDRGNDIMFLEHTENNHPYSQKQKPISYTTGFSMIRYQTFVTISELQGHSLCGFKSSL